MRLIDYPNIISRKNMDFFLKSIACSIMNLEMCDYQNKLHVMHKKLCYVLSDPWTLGVVKHLLPLGD